MEKDIVNYALDYAQSKKVEYAEARAHNTKHEELIVKNSVLDAFVSTIDTGFCIRILANGGLGFASTNKWTKDEAKAVVDTAYKFATIARRKDKITFAEEKGIEAKWSVEQQKKIEDIPPERKIEELMEIDKTLVSQVVKIPGRIMACTINLIEKYFVNSEGSSISSFVPSVELSLTTTTSYLNLNKSRNLINFKRFIFIDSFSLYTGIKNDTPLAKFFAI